MKKMVLTLLTGLLAVTVIFRAQAAEEDPLQPPRAIAEQQRQQQEEPQQRQEQPQQAAASARAESPAMTEEQVSDRLKKLVSLSFTNAELKNVLNGLAKTYGLNIVVGEEVQGTVNMTLKGVSLKEALDQILRINGFALRQEGTILEVISPKEAVVTEMLPLNFVTEDVAMEFLKALATDKGMMKSDETQNGILVTDKVSALEGMKEMLAQIDIPPQQVLIQAKLMDITHQDLDNLGLKLSSASFDIPLRAGSADAAQRLIKVASGALDVSGPSSDLTTDTISATISRGTSDSITATVDALIRDKRVKVLASPTVTTLNNVEAKITIGEKFPIKETTQTTTGTLQTTRFVDVGITLRVTPRINRAGFIQMQIHPEVSSVSATVTDGPRITTREADTTVIIRDKESVIIAGLIKEEETLTKDRIPLLGHIPFLGIMFQNRAKNYEQKELVIVITPFLVPVVPPQIAEGSDIEEARYRIEATQLYYEAEDYEMGKTLMSKQMNEKNRLLRAAELYEKLATQFPEHLFAPTALWRAGELHLSRLKEPLWAEQMFTRLMIDYPAHPYAEMARRRVSRLKQEQDANIIRQHKMRASR